MFEESLDAVTVSRPPASSTTTLKGVEIDSENVTRRKKKRTMPRSKEISEDTRRKVVEAHESGKGYKLISKAIGLPKTTIRAILRKWKRFGTVVTLPRSGRPSKISPTARREIIREVMKNPCMTSKDLQATLASSNICVHQSTIRRILGIHGRPTLSSFEGSMAVQTSSSQTGEGVLEESDGSSSPEVKTSKNEKRTMKKTNTNTNSDDKGAGSEKNRGQKTLDEEMPLAEVNGGFLEEVSTTNHSDGEGEIKSEESSSAGDAAKTVPTRPDGSKKRGNVETADAGRGRSGDTTEESSGVYSSDNNNTENWVEDMDYISALTFS